MAQLRTALSFIAVIVAVGPSAGQIMMVSPMVAGMRHHAHQSPHVRVVRPLFQPATIISRPAFTIAPAQMQSELKEPIDEQRLQERIKELEMIKQDIAQQQVELDEKIGVLEERALSVQKEIEDDHEVLRKLVEYQRIHSAEQLRLEQLIQRQRMIQNQQRMELERLARQRAAIEEWNKSQKEPPKQGAELAITEEPVTSRSDEKHNVESETTSSKPDDDQASEVQIQKPMQRFQAISKHKQNYAMSENPGITTGLLKNTEGLQVLKQTGAMEPRNTREDSKLQFERKTAGYDGVENKKI